MQAARRLEESLGLVRRTRAHVGRRPPNESTRKHHRRARRQLGKLGELLSSMQRQLLEHGASSIHVDRLVTVLDPLDAVLKATRVGESRTRAFKRIRKAAKKARHVLSE